MWPERFGAKEVEAICLGPEQVTGRVNKLGDVVVNRTTKGRFVKDSTRYGQVLRNA